MAVEVQRRRLEPIPGFRAGAVAADIKGRGDGRLDLALVAAEAPCAWAGTYTTNRVKAAPVLLCMERAEAGGPIRGVVLNSGNANACTGPQGMEDARAMARLAAGAVGGGEEEFLVCSTGVIGAPMPMERIAAAMPGLARSLSPEGLEEVARAILTTDTRPKTGLVELPGTGRMVGIAKGAGMIGPSMAPHATMLALILTDLALERREMEEALAAAVERSFNRVIVDGDTSTNDTCLFLASGLREAQEGWREALEAICLDLALQIGEDGEGCTKLVELRVEGAPSPVDAEAAARCIGTSPLVKTALYGEDPNWGRILAAAGRSGADFDPERCDLLIGHVPLVMEGRWQGAEAEARAATVMKGARFTITLRLHGGPHAFTVYTTDLSQEYVHINADYRT